MISDLNGEITKAQLVQEVALQFCNWYKAGGRGKEAAQKSNFKINRHKSIEIRINYNFQLKTNEVIPTFQSFDRSKYFNALNPHICAVTNA